MVDGFDVWDYQWSIMLGFVEASVALNLDIIVRVVRYFCLDGS